MTHDPNRLDPNRSTRRDMGGFNWNWVIGGLAALVVLFIAMSFFSGDDDRTAQTPPATTSGQGTTGTSSPRQSSSPNVAPTTPSQSQSNTDQKSAPATPPAR